MKARAQRLLLIEDHAATRTALRRLLAMRGWDVIEAASIAEGLEGLEPPPDCVVLDLMLPDGDGETILRRVREASLPTRVIVSTGTNDPDRLHAVGALGPQALLQKPVDLDRLCRVCEASAG